MNGNVHAHLIKMLSALIDKMTQVIEICDFDCVGFTLLQLPGTGWGLPCI